MPKRICCSLQAIIALFTSERRTESSGGGSSVYAIPLGDWFRWVSCPHYTAEVAMYACLAVILGWRNTTGLALFVWVLVNQGPNSNSIESQLTFQQKFS